MEKFVHLREIFKTIFYLKNQARQGQFRGGQSLKQFEIVWIQSYLNFFFNWFNRRHPPLCQGPTGQPPSPSPVRTSSVAWPRHAARAHLPRAVVGWAPPAGHGGTAPLSPSLSHPFVTGCTRCLSVGCHSWYQSRTGIKRHWRPYFQKPTVRICFNVHIRTIVVLTGGKLTQIYFLYLLSTIYFCNDAPTPR
jgi:hypothetical protein